MKTGATSQAYRYYSAALIALIFATYAASFTLNQIHSKNLPNAVILRYQNEKLADPANADTETVIVGDSSSGNAIDAAYFTRLSGHKTVSLSLTGSYSIMGSGTMIENAARRFPHLRNAIIMHSADVWRRPFSVVGYVMTKHGMSWDDFAGDKDRNELFTQYMSSVSSPAILWASLRNHLPFLKKKRLPEPLPGFIEPQWDFLGQYDNKFSAGRVPDDSEIIQDTISSDKTFELRYLDKICSNYRINCIYMHGPLLDAIYKQQNGQYDKFNALIKENAPHVQLVTKAFYYPAGGMGDSPDHADHSIKKKVTQDYFNHASALLKF